MTASAAIPCALTLDLEKIDGRYRKYIPRRQMDTAKLFKNGRSQAVRLPKEYRFPGNQVFLRKVGNGVLLMPEEGSWDSLIESVSHFSDDFLSERDQGVHEHREGLFE
jgi:antitoxin VapB